VKDLYKEDYKLLRKEIEEDNRRWKDLPCSWIGRISIMKMAILPKAIYIFNEIPIKNPMTFITEIEKSTLKFIWKHKTSWIVKAIPSKKSNAGDNPNTCLQTILLSHSNKNSTVLAQKQTWRPTEQNRRTKYAHLIFDKGPKNIWWRKDVLFNKCCWENLIICLQKTETRSVAVTLYKYQFSMDYGP
jgi:hypothetical protein